MQKIKDESVDMCSKCRSPIKYNDIKGILVCTSCGELKEDRIVSLTSEYRYFNDDTSGRSDPRRVGNPVNMHMDSQIDQVEIEDFPNGRKHYMTYALQSNADKNYTRAIKLINKFCDLLDLAILKKPAEEIYFEVKDSPEIKGKRLEATIAAIIFLAGRQKHVYIELRAFEGISGTDKSILIKACNIICKLTPRIVVKAADMIKRHFHDFKIPRSDLEILTKMCDAIENYDVFGGKRPKDGSIAASVLYYFSTKRQEIAELTLERIKQVTGVGSDALIRQYAETLESKNLYNLVMKPLQQESQDSRMH